MIPRHALEASVRSALRRARVVALLGPRQCGKTTVARTLVAAGSRNYFDLEDPVAAARLDEPMTALAPLRGLVVIDEVQRRPRLFEILRVLADRRPLPARFLVLGSASPELVRDASESLAGRVATIDMSGFSLAEVGASRSDRLWLRGGFPPSFLARSNGESAEWRRDFVRTFLERDLPLAGIRLPSVTVLRFWTMLAHWHGGVWNGAELARSFGVSVTAVRHYLDVLTGHYMVRQLQPWQENLSKRQVKAPKVYVRDSGLLHHLLGIRDDRGLASHPKVGASWEGFAIEEAIRATSPDEAYFWATHAGAELDLLIFKDGRRIGVEAKRADAPKLTPSMRVALADLRLDRLVVLHPGDRRYPLGPRVEAVPLRTLAEDGGAAVLRGGLHPRRPPRRDPATAGPVPRGRSGDTMTRKPTTIDAYLATVSGDRRAALVKLRRTIRSIIPKAEECISYAIPAFRLDGVVVAGFCATAKGCSFFPFSGSTLGTLADELEGYEQTKSSLHFRPDAPLPVGLVRKLIRARIAEEAQRRGER